MVLTETEKGLMSVFKALLPITENVVEKLVQLDCTEIDGHEISGLEIYTKSELFPDGDFVWNEKLKGLPDTDIDFIRVDDYADLKFIMFDFNKKEIVDYEFAENYE